MRVTKKDAIVVNFFSDDYKEAQKKVRSGRYGPAKLGMNEVVKGWELACQE